MMSSSHFRSSRDRFQGVRPVMHGLLFLSS